MRADFVYGNDTPMSYTKSIIANGDALAYVSIADPPTVTLPRIKVQNGLLSRVMNTRECIFLDRQLSRY